MPLVKELDRYGREIEPQQRYVAIISGGHALCTCLRGQNLGIPCRHFFAVMKLNPDIRFSLAQVHDQWIFPEKRRSKEMRPWVRCLSGDLRSTGGSETLPPVLRERPPRTTEVRTDPIASAIPKPNSEDQIAAQYIATASQPYRNYGLPQTPKRRKMGVKGRRAEHQSLADLLNKAMDAAGNDHGRMESLQRALNGEIQQSNWRHEIIHLGTVPGSNLTSNVTPSMSQDADPGIPSDPIPQYSRGRKQSSRHKSSTELKRDKGGKEKM